MMVLAIETSTPQGSVALLRDERCIAQFQWMTAGHASQSAFPAVRKVLAEAQCAVREVDLFVAGRGPGNYSGMRMALTLVQSLALVQNAEVQTADSGAVLADAVFDESDSASVTLVGDARRGQIWTGVFNRSDVLRSPCGGWMLLHPDQLVTASLSEVVATSEWDRMSLIFSEYPAVAALRWMEGSRYPTAEQLARLVLRRRAAGYPGDPLTPLYLHPAVKGG